MTPKQRNFLRGLVVSIILAATAYTGANATDLTTDSAVSDISFEVAVMVFPSTSIQWK